MEIMAFMLTEILGTELGFKAVVPLSFPNPLNWYEAHAFDKVNYFLYSVVEVLIIFFIMGEALILGIKACHGLLIYFRFMMQYYYD